MMFNQDLHNVIETILRDSSGGVKMIDLVSQIIAVYRTSRQSEAIPHIDTIYECITQSTLFAELEYGSTPNHDLAGRVKSFVYFKL